MGNKAEYRNVKIHIGWQCASHIAKLIHRRIGNADVFELVYQVPGEYFLFFCAGKTVRARLGLRIKTYVF